MKSQSSDSPLLFPHSLTSIGELLTRFAECSLFTFSAKDIKTHKIFIHNKACAELYGLSDNGLVGMTSRECLEQIAPFTHKEDALKRWENEDLKAITNNRGQTNIITILDYEGFVRIRQHLTIPICSESKKVIAISAFCYDRTDHIELLSLFKQYEKYYTKVQAVIKLSKYLGLEEFFQFRLTRVELYTLLTLVQAPRHKQAAHLLSVFRKKVIAPATISGYVNHMKDKLKSHLELDTVLSHLRRLNQWTLDPNTF